MTSDEAFTHAPVITTDRLCIRPMRMTDAEAVFVFKSDPEVTRCYGQDPHQTIDETEDWIQRNLSSYERREAISWILSDKAKDHAIGECCLWNFDPSLSCAEIGYELRSDHRGHGIMTEALSAILTYGFRGIGLHRIEANPFAINEPSLHLLRKLGFKHEGTLRQRQLFHGQYLDQMYFGMLDDEWI